MRQEATQERWDIEKGKEVADKRIDDFLQEIASVCKRHGFSISHEDEHGAFVIEAYDEAKIEWLMGAYIGRSISSI